MYICTCLSLQVTPGSYCFENAHNGVVMSLAITANNVLVSSGSDGSIRVWDLKKIMYAQVRMSITVLPSKIVLQSELCSIQLSQMCCMHCLIKRVVAAVPLRIHYTISPL